MASILKVDTIQDQDGNNIINESADTITIGASGDTITVPTGASLTVPSGGLSGQNYPAFEAYLSADQTVSDNVITKVQFDTEVFDTDSTYDNATNYRFTPTVAGKYYIYSSVQAYASTNSDLIHIDIYLYKNASTYKLNHYDFRTNYANWFTASVDAVVDMNGTGDYVEIYGAYDAVSGTPKFKGSASRWTYFGAYRIGA